MTGGQEKNFSTLGPKLRENRAQQYHGDKSLQIRVVESDYGVTYLLTAEMVRLALRLVLRWRTVLVEARSSESSDSSLRSLTPI